MAITYPTNEHRIATLLPGYPDAYLMQGRYGHATPGLSAGPPSTLTASSTTPPSTGRSRHEAVNQWSWRNPFRENLAILSHQLEGDLGLWWLTVASEIEKQALYNVLSTVISRAWILFERWGEIPVDEMNADGELVWRAALPDQMERHRLMCGMCDIPDFVRTFYDNTTAERYGGFGENHRRHGPRRIYEQVPGGVRLDAGHHGAGALGASCGDRCRRNRRARHSGRSQHGDPFVVEGNIRHVGYREKSLQS